MIKTVKERPILFSTAMVQAILEGRKTQTRRVVKLPKEVDPNHFDKASSPMGTGEFTIVHWPYDHYELVTIKCPYGQVGDVLWVRETWAAVGCIGGHPYEHIYQYKADFPNGNWSGGADWCFEGWKPSIHMPYAACRLRLEITNIRVERLQDISEGDAIAEGISESKPIPLGWKHYISPNLFLKKDKIYDGFSAASMSFFTLWSSINKQEGWIDNRWVWVVEFKVKEVLV
jgi:hypothetical protein